MDKSILFSAFQSFEFLKIASMATVSLFLGKFSTSFKTSSYIYIWISGQDGIKNL